MTWAAEEAVLGGGKLPRRLSRRPPSPAQRGAPQHSQCQGVAMPGTAHSWPHAPQGPNGSRLSVVTGSTRRRKGGRGLEIHSHAAPLPRG
jgi:hypothetical protein